MDYYTLKEDTYIVRCRIDGESLRDLQQYLKQSEMVASLSVSAFTTDSVPDLTKIVDDVRNATLTVIIAKEVLSMGREVVKEGLVHLIKTWINNQNEGRKSEIEAGKVEPIIYDAIGQTISVKKKKP